MTDLHQQGKVVSLSDPKGTETMFEIIKALVVLAGILASAFTMCAGALISTPMLVVAGALGLIPSFVLMKSIDVSAT